MHSIYSKYIRKHECNKVGNEENFHQIYTDKKYKI